MARRISDGVLLFGLFVFAFWGTSHVMIDAGIGGSRLRILPCITGILSVLLALKMWKRLTWKERLGALVIFIVGAIGILGLIDWLFLEH